MMISGYEIKVKNINNLNSTKEEIKNLLGEDYKVMSFAEIRGGLYKILETEKLVVYAIFSMILILSSLKIFFLLIMMSVEKTRDISILYSICVKRNTVKNTFILQGVLIGMSCVFLGLFFGIMISFLQQETGFVKINLPNSIINAYPVKIEAYDVFLITIIVLIISSIASIFPSIITSSTKNFENTSNNLS